LVKKISAGNRKIFAGRFVVYDKSCGRTSMAINSQFSNGTRMYRRGINEAIEIGKLIYVKGKLTLV